MKRVSASRATSVTGRSARVLRTLTPDDAFIALLIAAMEASGHVSPDEAARAHNLIWSTRRFRNRSGERVGRAIARMKSLVSSEGPAAVLEASANALPRRLRPAAFALASDLVLVDGKMTRSEARFLRALSAALGLRQSLATSVLDVIRIKNSA
jgi:tellurite resistance protein